MNSGGFMQGARGLVVGVSGEASIGWHAARFAQAQGAEVAVTHRAHRAAPAGFAWTATLDIDGTDDEASIAACFAEAARRWERLDFIIHTVMHVPPELLAVPLVDVPRASFDAVVGTAAHSLVAVTRAALPLLERSAAPRIVAVTSACARRATPRYHVAGIAKAALDATVLYLAHELGSRGILVNAISPALIPTDGARATVGDAACDATRAHLARKSPTRRATELDDVARAITWLASPLAANLTGQIIDVDGGYATTYL